MIIKFGEYRHPEGEVELAVDRQALFTDGETLYAERWRIDLVGMLVGDSQRDIDVKVRALAAAYQRRGVDFVVEASAGGRLALTLRHRDTLGGIRVVRPPSFPGMRGAAYVTHLPYAITLEAEVPLSSVSTGYRRFSERIRRSGGGPSRGYMETLNTMPVPYRGRVATVYHTTQSGEAVGLYAYPTPPPPIWPSALVEAPQFDVASPRRRNGAYDDFPISWSYRFESVVPLYGAPRRWGT